MEPEGSTSCSHESATVLCYEADESNPRPKTLSRKSILIASLPLRLYLASDLFPSDVQTKISFPFIIDPKRLIMQISAASSHFIPHVFIRCFSTFFSNAFNVFFSERRSSSVTFLVNFHNGFKFSPSFLEIFDIPFF
jgi:hypothetical protein